MNTTSLAIEVKGWINGSKDRFELMKKHVPIAESTLKATIHGRYNPGPHLERAIRGVMQEFPLVEGPEAVQVKGSAVELRCK